MRPETELLRLCAVTSVSDERLTRLQAVARGALDWRSFSELAWHHRLFPLAYKALAQHARSSVPAEVLKGLRNLYFENLGRNLAARKELVRILEALGQSGVTAAPYKGPVLAELAYGDVGLRCFNDLDILVREDDLDRVTSVLQSLGYDPGFAGNRLLLERYRTYLRDFAFRSPSGVCPAEIQWRLAPKCHPVFRDRESVWRRLRSRSVGGAPVRTLSAEDTLLALCLHGLYHSWEHLQMVSDVAAAVTADPPPDWRAALENARRQGGRRILLLGLLLARELLGMPLPVPIQEAAAADRFALGLASRVSGGFFERVAYFKKARAFFFREGRMIQGLGNRVRFFWGRMLTPNEEDTQALLLPAGLFVFHPALRLVRLFKKYLLGP